ncbi:MAG: hypothetical protein HZB84_06700 [Deltaproteobacteria bacterium]|nr:hypothetical protein [Deltaproteobacteria bacterium]
MVAEEAGGGAPVILIGDGRSDFCLAGKAAYIFSKRRLVRHCMDNALAHTAFETFSDVRKHVEIFVMHMRKGRHAAEWRHQLQLTLETKI